MIGHLIVYCFLGEILPWKVLLVISIYQKKLKKKKKRNKEIGPGIFTSDLVWFNVDPVSFAKTPFEGKAVPCPVHYHSRSI